MSEVRLIDTNRLIKSIEANRFTAENVKSLFRITVEAQPTVDAVSCEGCTHKGKWENEYENGYSSPCTNCKRRALDNWERMDGERSET